MPVVRLALLAVMLLLPRAAASQSLERTFVTDGYVLSLASDGSQLYLGGKFSYIGQRSGELALVTADTGLRDKSIAELGGGAVNAIASDGAGGHFLGGDFRSTGSTRIRGFAHLAADGTWDPKFRHAVNGIVHAVATDGIRVYIGGSFVDVDGVSRRNFAAFDVATGALSSLELTTERVYAMAIQGSTLFVGGSFNGIGGVSRRNLARIDLATNTVSSWQAPDPNDEVHALFVRGSTLYVGGRFTQMGGQPRTGVAAVDATTGALRGFNPNVGMAVFALTRQDTSLYIGGYVNAGGFRSRVVAVDASTGAALPFDAQVDGSGSVYALLATPSALYVGGAIETVGGQARRHAAALDPATGALLPWRPHPSKEVRALAARGTGVLLGGYFNSVGGQDRRNLAAIELATGRATTWKPATDPAAISQVVTLHLAGGVVYVGGTFTTLAGQPRGNLGAVSAATGAVLPLRADTNGVVRALASLNGTLYVGGEFTALAGSPRTRLGAVDATTGALRTWSYTATATVRALAAVGARVYAGGDLGLVALDASTGASTGIDYGVFRVSALVVDGTRLVVGGLFSSIRGQTRNGLAILDHASGDVLPWSQTPVTGANWFVAVAVSATKIYAAGSSLGQRVFAFDKSTGATGTFAPVFVQPDLFAMLSIGDRLAISGAYDSVNGISQSPFAVFTGAP